MELFVFVRFHATPGNEAAVEAALREVTPPTRQEDGCLEINVFRSIRDPQIFYIHSRWKDEAAFDLHATLPHTVRFIGTVEPLLDHRVEAQRCTILS
jgi:quinol monooxygenase YgiN